MERPLLNEWEEYRPSQLVPSVERVLRDAIFRLIALGPDAARDSKLTVVRRAIEQINELNAASQFIDSIERDDLCAIFYQILDLCGVNEGGAFVDAHRDW